jgi:hypothetical protein
MPEKAILELLFDAMKQVLVQSRHPVRSEAYRILCDRAPTWIGWNVGLSRQRTLLPSQSLISSSRFPFKALLTE